MKTVKQIHAQWEKSIGIDRYSDLQRQEMERAFYSGAFAILDLQFTEIAELPDDKAEKELDSISSEIFDYFKNLSKIPSYGVSGN